MTLGRPAIGHTRAAVNAASLTALLAGRSTTVPAPVRRQADCQPDWQWHDDSIDPLLGAETGGGGAHLVRRFGGTNTGSRHSENYVITASLRSSVLAIFSKVAGVRATVNALARSFMSSEPVIGVFSPDSRSAR